MAAERDFTSSLARMWVTWTLTVPRLTNSVVGNVLVRLARGHHPQHVELALRQPEAGRRRSCSADVSLLVSASAAPISTAGSALLTDA